MLRLEEEATKRKGWCWGWFVWIAGILGRQIMKGELMSCMQEKKKKEDAMTYLCIGLENIQCKIV